MMSFVVEALQGMTRWDSADTRRTDGFAVVEQHPDTSVHCMAVGSGPAGPVLAGPIIVKVSNDRRINSFTSTPCYENP